LYYIFVQKKEKHLKQTTQYKINHIYIKSIVLVVKQVALVTFNVKL